MHFDARTAKLLEPGAHMVVDGCPGLRLESSASRKTWQYRYKAVATGRMKQVALGQWPAMSVQAAVARWQELRAQRAAGADPVQQRKAQKQAVQRAAAAIEGYPVRLLLQRYSAQLVQLRQANGALAAQRALNRLLEADPEFADMEAAAVTRADAFRVIDARKATPTAAAKLRSLLGAAWDSALDSGDLPDGAPNWWRQVLRGALKSKGKRMGGLHVGQQRRVLPPAEVSALLAWLPNMHPLGADAVVLYLWTCTRGVEIFGMRPEHVAKQGATWWWTVPKMQTKNARHADAVDLRVPLYGRALKVVKRRLKAVGPSGWLFEDARGEQYTQHDFSTYIYNLQPYSGKVRGRQGDGLVLPVTNWTPHNLRRTGRTLLAALGCPNEIGEAIVGHMPEEMVGTYNAYTYDAERRLWLGKLSAYLEGLAAGSA